MSELDLKHTFTASSQAAGSRQALSMIPSSTFGARGLHGSGPASTHVPPAVVTTSGRRTGFPGGTVRHPQTSTHAARHRRHTFNYRPFSSRIAKDELRIPKSRQRDEG